MKKIVASFFIIVGSMHSFAQADAGGTVKQQTETQKQKRPQNKEIM